MELASEEVFFISNDFTYARGNKLTHFTNFLPSPLSCEPLTEKWQMAMQRVILDMSFALTDMTWSANNIAIWYDVGYARPGGSVLGLSQKEKLSSILLLENVALSDINVLVHLNSEFNKFRGLAPRHGRMLKQHANLQFLLDHAGFVVISIPRYMKVKIGRPILFALGFRETQVTAMLRSSRWIGATDNTNYIIHKRRYDGTTRIKASEPMNVGLLGPDFFKVECGAIVPNITTERHGKKCIYSRECGMTLARGSIEVEPRHLRYYDLLNSEVSSVSFIVHNAANDVLPIAFGQPTIIQARFRKVLRSMDREHIVRISTADDKNQQCVVSDKFTVQLSSRVFASPLSNWKVALLDFSFPVAFNHIAEECRRRAGHFWIHQVDAGFLVPFRARSLHWSSEESMIEEYNIMLRKAATPVIGIFSINKQGYTTFTFNSQGTIKLHSSILLTLGASLEEIENNLEGYIWMHNGQEMVGQKSITFHNKADRFANVPHSLIIYSNIVAPSPIGSKLTKVLGILHLSLTDIAEKEDRYHTIEPKHLNYVKLAFSELESLEFHIRDVAGDILNMRTTCRRPIVFNLSIKHFP